MMFFNSYTQDAKPSYGWKGGSGMLEVYFFVLFLVETRGYTRVKLIFVPRHVLVVVLWLVKMSHSNRGPPEMAGTKPSSNEDHDGSFIA